MEFFREMLDFLLSSKIYLGIGSFFLTLIIGELIQMKLVHMKTSIKKGLIVGFGSFMISITIFYSGYLLLKYFGLYV